jgi:hypothetical protein
MGLSYSFAQLQQLRDILEIHSPAGKVAADDARMAAVVELRDLGGLSNGKVAATSGVAE